MMQRRHILFLIGAVILAAAVTVWFSQQFAGGWVIILVALLASLIWRIFGVRR